jgi:selenocysteine lyase/cysteine desulfurase
MDINEIRRAFPALESGVYLNTAAVGICPSGTGSTAARFFDDYLSQGFNARERWRESETLVQAGVAQLLKLSDHDLQFTSSTTEALNLVAHSLRLQPGDQVVFAADEFASVRHAWETHRSNGVTLVPVPIEREEDRTSVLASAVTARTRVLCVSHVHWCTGTRVDLPELANVCHRHGALLIVDGVQAAGAIDVDASHADIYAASVFKWLLSAFGLAYLAIRRSVFAQLSPAFVGYANEPPSRSLRYAHVNYPGINVLGSSLEFMTRVGWPQIFARVADLGELLHRELSHDGWNVITPLRQRAGIVSVTHAQSDALVSALAERGCSVELRGGLIRFSPHFYNTEEDVHALLRTLRQLR